MTRDINPSVHIHEANASPAHLAEICAGLEEEGIPCTIISATGDAKTLAIEAANNSKLRVGIGITANDALLQMRNCPIDIPLEETNPTLYVNLESNEATRKLRALGTNAARAIKGGIFI